MFDHGSLVASLVGVSIPIFFLALDPQVHLRGAARLAAEHRPPGRLADHADTRPTSTSSTGSSPATGCVLGRVKHLILPAIALGSIPLAIIARITRAAVLDVQNEDYVRTARAKGLATAHRRLAARAPKRAAAGLDDHRPPDRAAAVGRRPDRDGVRLPGIGIVAREAIFNRDYPVIQGGILFLAIVFVVVNLLVDISYAIINPGSGVS